MRLLGLKCKTSNVSRYNSYKGQVGKTVKNLLLNKVVDKENHKTYYERNFKVSKMNEVWCTDVTEFKLGEDKIYLSPIIDLYNEEIIAYDLSEHPTMYKIWNMMTKRIINFFQMINLFYIAIKVGNINKKVSKRI